MMTQESIQPMLDWISANPTGSGFLVFLISLAESLAIVGLFVPGVVLMTAIGGMMGAGILPLWETLLWAILGAIAGDGISYWLGYHYHERLRDIWPFKQFPQLLSRGEVFFKHHGGKSIVFGRFVGPVRPMIPVIAGMMDMSPKRFLFFNILSAIVWAPLYSLPGILIGASLGSLSPEVARRAGLLVILLLLALWVLYEGFILMGSWIGKGIQYVIRSLAHTLHRSPCLKQILTTQKGSADEQLGLAVFFLIACAGFFRLCLDVWHESGITAWNEPVYQVLRALYSNKLICITGILTNIGEPFVLLPVISVIGLKLLWDKRYAAGICWGLTIGIGITIGHFLKPAMAVTRPDGLAYLNPEYAFPSGHTLTATLTFALSAFLLKNAISRQYRWIPLAISVALILWVAISRLYLGVHWFTDILGGLTLGFTCVTCGVFFYRRIESKSLKIKSFIPGGWVFVITFSLYSMVTYPDMRQSLVRQWPTHVLTETAWQQGTNNIYSLHRTGAFKRQATLFDIQWLSPLTAIKQTLQEAGWVIVPKLSFNTCVMFLANNPDPSMFPVMPKFHRDRLPVLTVAKKQGDSTRLVLQIWQSDYKTEAEVPLWVGTLRIEAATHPLPLVTVYREAPYDGTTLRQFEQTLKKHAKDTGIRWARSKTETHPEILLLTAPKDG